MPIDFSKLGTSNAIDTTTDPIALFSALPRIGGTFQYLRNVQSDVLGEWHTRRTQRDLIIKMNTGAGKTVVGLLILKASLNEGISPAIYICPDIDCYCRK